MKKVILFLFTLLSLSKAIAQILPPTPNTYLTDKVSIIEANYYDSITNVLADLEDKTGVQFLVYIDKTLYTQNLEDYSNKLFNHWKLGQKGKDNGILLAIFLNDRKFRIEIGYGLEAKIPDLLANRIQEQYLVPEFRNGNFGKGIYDCTKGLYDAATDYKYDLNGEKRIQYLESLIVYDNAGVLSLEDRNDLLYIKNRNYSQYLDNYEDFTLFYYIGNEKTPAELKQKMIKQWSEIQTNFPNEKNKIFVGYSASAPIYNVYLSDAIKPYFKESSADYLSDFTYGEYFESNFNNKEFKYLMDYFCYSVQSIIEVNSFKNSNPIYTFFFESFYEKNDRSFCYDYYRNLIFSSVGLVVLIPFLLLNLFMLFSKGVDSKAKAIVLFWSVCNHLLIFFIIGYLMNLSLLFKAYKIFRKKGDWQKIVADILKRGFLGDLKDGFLGKGGGSTYSSGGSSYRSSGSSWSSSSSSSSRSSSSSSSSSRSFSGGGGGRSGGGGSSGSW